MRRSFASCCGALLLAGLAGCATVPPFAAPTLVPLPPRTAAAVAASDWSQTQEPLTIRQSALLQMAGRSWMLNGLLLLDPAAGSARLVALDDMGVKLFDLSVTAAGSEVHYLLPPLERVPGLMATIAASVRRIYVDPRPNEHDILQIHPDRYLLRRSDAEGETLFLFGGEPLQLLEKSRRVTGDARGGWQVRYYEYRTLGGLDWPRGIVLSDEAAGLRLTLWLESVKGRR